MSLLLGICISAVALAPRPLNGAQGERSLGLPPLPVVVTENSTPQQIALGHNLFFDARFSADQKISCASCHNPALAFTDGRKIAQGTAGKKGVRNSPSLVMAAYGTSFFWDGRRPTLEAQAIDPLTNPIEHGLPNTEAALAVVRGDANYTSAFQTAYGVRLSAISIEHIGKALASYERSLAIGDSPFDRYYYGGDGKSLSDAAIRGLQLFQGRGQCVSCHVIGKDGALFTDNQFHSIGVGLGKLQARFADVAMRVVEARANPLDTPMPADADVSELGRFAVTMQPADIGKFKTPTLRNVAVTAPYMHDGSVATLEETVDAEIYYRGIESGYLSTLTRQEKSDLVACLKSLTSSQFKAAEADAVIHRQR